MPCAAVTTSRSRPLLAWVALALLLAVGAGAVARLASSFPLPVYDWVLYWSAGELSLRGDDPYARANLYPLQHQEKSDLAEGETILFYNPPWSLAILMPFGLLRSFTVFRLAWAVMLLLAVVFCATWVWQRHEGPARVRAAAWVVAFTFLPVLNVIQSGQIGPLVLLGVVGFLHFVGRGRDWAAGAVLLLAAVKPHLVGLFWLALLLWAFDRRRWAVLAGGLLAGAAATALPLLFNPHLLAQFWQTMTQNSPSQQWITPTLGSVLRLSYRGLGFGDDLPLLQYVPALVGALVLPIYYLRKRREWDWDEEMPVLLFASFLAAPYGAWVADMVVLLLPVVQMAARSARGGQHRLLAGAAVVYLAINAVAGWASIGVHQTWWFFWMPPALCLLYLAVRRYSRPARAALAG